MSQKSLKRPEDTSDQSPLSNPSNTSSSSWEDIEKLFNEASSEGPKDVHLNNNRTSAHYKDTKHSSPTILTGPTFSPPILPSPDRSHYKDIDPLLSAPKKSNTVLRLVKKKSLKESKSILLKSFKGVSWNNPVGIDKIQLTTKDFKLESSANFRLRYHDRHSLEDFAKFDAIFSNDSKAEVVNSVRQDLVDHADFVPHHQLPLLTTENEEVVRGRSLYRNFDFFNVDITKFGDYPSLRINLNPSKMCNKFFGNLANPEDVKICLREIEKICSEQLTLKLNLADANLTRLDLAKDREMDQSVYQYNEVFNHLKLTRSKHQQQYPSGFMQSNSRRAYIFYDKGVEYLDRKIPSSNYMRGEYRFTRAESCQSAELYTPNSLYRLGVDGINQTYNDLFTDTILRVSPNSPGQLCINYSDLTSIMDYVIKNYKRNQVLRFKDVLSTHYLVEVLKNVDLESFFLQYFERNHVYNIMKDLRTTVNLVKPSDSKFNLISAYHEVKEKFAA